jgi:multiple sugar transport system permease protein
MIVSKRTRSILRNIGIYTCLAIFVVLMLFPFYFMFVTSIKPDSELYSGNCGNIFGGMDLEPETACQDNPLWVRQPTIAHYRYLFTSTDFLMWLKNSLVVSGVSTGISIVIGTLAAYSLARIRFKGAQALGTMIFVTYLVPTTLLFLPMAYVIRSLGLYDKPITLMITYPTFLIPFCTWLLMGYFRGTPRELEECAMMDGATRLQALRMIILPIMLPGIVSAGLFAFTLSWNEFVYALTLVSSNIFKTLPVGVVSQLVLADVYFWGALMAAALLGSIPIAILYSFFLEYYVKGMTAGAVKG